MSTVKVWLMMTPRVCERFKHPLDRAILGLEEYMGDVVDTRPDRFLREMREHGTWAVACKKSGLTRNEVEQLCVDNARFDLAQTECQLEYHEEIIVKATEQAIEAARKQRDIRVSQLRDTAMQAYRKRHA